MTRGSGTETTGQIQIGRVSERDHTRHHAIRDGHAACGRGKILLHHVVPLTVVTAKNACGHRACRKAIRLALDLLLRHNGDLAWGPVRRLGERALLALRDLFRTKAEIARDEAMAAGILANMTATGAYVPATTYAEAA